MPYSVQKAIPLREQVYGQLLHALRMGEFKPGERVTEEKAAKLLHVSRTPVREALGLLGKHGILSDREKGGYFVPDPSVKEIEDVFEVRGLLEPYAASLAAKNCTDEELTKLDAILKRERAAQKLDNPSESFELNLEFRRTLIDISRNARLAHIIGQFEDHLQFVGMLTMQEKSVRKIIIDGHQRLLSALKARDPRGAEKAMKSNLKAASKALSSALQKYHA